MYKVHPNHLYNQTFPEVGGKASQKQLESDRKKSSLIMEVVKAAATRKEAERDEALRGPLVSRWRRLLRVVLPGNYWKIILAWGFVILLNLVSAVCCIMFAKQFGNDGTRMFLLSFLFGIGYSYLVVEPAEIMLLICLPFLLSNSYALEIRFWFKEVFG